MGLGQRGAEVLRVSARRALVLDIFCGSDASRGRGLARYWPLLTARRTFDARDHARRGDLSSREHGRPLAVVKQHSYNYELAAMYVIVLGYFTAAGAGSISVDEQVLGGELEFYYQLTMGGDKEER